VYSHLANFPAPQSLQALAADVSWYCPRAQTMQVLLPVSLNFPCAHALHEMQPAPSVQKRPAAQSLQLSSMGKSENWPLLHVLQPYSVGPYLPAGHTNAELVLSRAIKHAARCARWSNFWPMPAGGQRGVRRFGLLVVDFVENSLTDTHREREHLLLGPASHVFAHR